MTAQRPTHQVPLGHLRLLGDMSVTFGIIHFQLMTLVQQIIGLDKMWKQAITAELSLAQLRSIALSVYRARFGEDSDFLKLRELITRSEALEQRRNSITHSLWTVGQDMTQTSRLKVTAKQNRGLKHTFEDMTEASLLEEIANFHKLADDLTTFEIEVGHHLAQKPSVHPWA